MPCRYQRGHDPSLRRGPREHPIFLPARPLSETALREIDVDPDKVSLRYDGGFRDPLIEQIARNIHAEMLDPAPAGKILVETLASALGAHVLRNHSNLESAPVSLPAASIPTRSACAMTVGFAIP